MGKIKALQCAFTAAILLSAYGTAHAEDWKVTGTFGWFGVGKTYQIEKGHLYFVGEFSGTFFNDKGDGSLFDKAGVKCPGFYDIDQNNKKGNAAGYCTISNASGVKPTSAGNVRATEYVATDRLNILGARGNTPGLPAQIIPSLQQPR
jgi:hypothetical protein